MPLETARTATLDELAASAVDGWLTHGIGGLPVNVSVVKEPRRKSTVLRLHGAGPDGEAVIAKRCHAQVARTEQTVYEQILPKLPVVTLRLYAATQERQGLTWLFIEDAGDGEWSPDVHEHRVLAADWLSTVHSAAAELVGSVELPRRDAGYYLDLVRTARNVVEDALQNDAIDTGGKQVLEELVSCCDQLDARWDDISELLIRFPTTLALPGLGRKNCRLRTTTERRSTFLPFDFESAGWGVLAAELTQVDVGQYAARSAHRGRCRPTDLERLAAIGGGLRAIKSIGGEASTLVSPWPAGAMGKLDFYATRVAAALSALEPRHPSSARG